MNAERQQRIAAWNPKGRSQPEWAITPEILQYQLRSVTLTQSALASITTATGGWTMFLERPEQAEEIYSRIFSDINRRYIVGYYPTNKEHDGKRRKLDVTVRDHPDYLGHRTEVVLRTRAGPIKRMDLTD